ncbi:hypothetical protein [Polynucleobacter sp. IMCC 30228]|jgi:hypothetical protein|uniref:hypothetical protein n=1 Tax=Polynucleobacter sp. IMCC 30228 TaxID=2781011 RepID=UPI001F2C3B01|nr:hypothetical protein [Polynucleobacter sp. IMCC 30228]
MVSNKIFTLIPDDHLSGSNNLFLCALFIREELRKFRQIKVQIPANIYRSVSKNDFNTFFSDPLIDLGLTDSDIKIEIKDIPNIELEAT